MGRINIRKIESHLKPVFIENAAGSLLQSSFIAFVLLVSGLFVAHAQPSGGPYGPINQTYDLPKVPAKYTMLRPMERLNRRATNSHSQPQLSRLLQMLKPAMPLFFAVVLTVPATWNSTRE